MAHSADDHAHAETQLGSLNKVPPRAMRHHVREALQEAILSGELKPGDRLVESAIARQMGVSETPVREAIRELENAGLIVTYPHRATFVRTYTRDELSETYSLRAQLEHFAVHLAMPHLTPADLDHLQETADVMCARAREGDATAMIKADVAFHAYVVEKAGHSLLVRTWRSISPPNSTYMTVVTLTDRGLEFHARRHNELLEALRAGDVSQAADAFKDHILTLSGEVLSRIPADVEVSSLNL